VFFFFFLRKVKLKLKRARITFLSYSPLSYSTRKQNIESKKPKKVKWKRDSQPRRLHAFFLEQWGGIKKTKKTLFVRFSGSYPVRRGGVEGLCPIKAAKMTLLSSPRQHANIRPGGI
jgi:hypothetical protein